MLLQLSLRKQNAHLLRHSWIFVSFINLHGQEARAGWLISPPERQVKTQLLGPLPLGEGYWCVLPGRGHRVKSAAVVRTGLRSDQRDESLHPPGRRAAPRRGEHPRCAHPFATLRASATERATDRPDVARVLLRGCAAHRDARVDRQQRHAILSPQRPPRQHVFNNR